MNLPSDLLEQARHLARRESKRPRQASLRRAVSAAYYALFHLLTTEAATLFAANAGVIAALSRVIDHGELAAVSRHFAAGKLPKVLGPTAGPAFSAAPAVVLALKRVAAAFVALQEARHEADYDLTRRFTRRDVIQLIDRVDGAFTDWAAIRRTDQARLYLGCFLLWERWNKQR